RTASPAGHCASAARRCRPGPPRWSASRRDCRSQSRPRARAAAMPLARRLRRPWATPASDRQPPPGVHAAVRRLRPPLRPALRPSLRPDLIRSCCHLPRASSVTGDDGPGRAEVTEIDTVLSTPCYRHRVTASLRGDLLRVLGHETAAGGVAVVHDQGVI